MKRIAHLALVLVAALAAPLLGGCAGAMPDVAPVRPENLGTNGKLELPMVIELREGDRLPIDLDVGGDLVRTEGGTSAAAIVVKRRFFLVLQKQGPPRISLDGKTLGGVMGSFAIGVGAEKGHEPRASVRLKIVERR